MKVDWLIVGAGFTGLVVAERIASQLGERVLVVERRNHIGGNAYDHYDEAGVLVHKYGPHIFHTQSKEVFDYLSVFADVAEPVDRVRTSEDVVVSKVGRELYEKFFRNYTRKQWDLDPSELDASVTSRVPTRTNRDDRYFTDTYQAMPLHGYTRMFENMLDHPNIKVMLNTDYREIVDLIPFDEMVYSGPVDEFFDLRFGKLPY